MDAKQRQLEQEKAERQLDETQARLRTLDATAREHQADAAIAEVTGLQALQDRVRKQFQAWKEADQASVEELREEVKRGNDALTRGAQAASDRLDRFTDANDRWLDAEVDQLGGIFQMFEAWLGEQWVADKQVAANTQADLRSGHDDLARKRQALKDAAPAKKAAARGELKRSAEGLKQKLKAVAERLKGKPAGAEQRP
jgi:hypothetical protein